MDKEPLKNRPASIVIHTDENLKNEAIATFKLLDLTLSQGVTLYLQEITATGKLPFEVQSPATRIDAENQAALTAAERGELLTFTPTEYSNHLRKMMTETHHSDD